jgi:uncharacterized protein YdeI (YjbR/CyaY-like superfamily)
MRQSLSANKLLCVSDRSEWRAWLRSNYNSTPEIWLVYYKKHTGKPRISYNDAVEEALCFGWIDSTVRTLDGDRFAQRFSVRRTGSHYSQANVERVRALLKDGKVAKDVMESLPDLSGHIFTIPADILKAIKSNAKAWRNFQRFSPPYIRIRVAFIDGARNRPAEFKKRLSHLIRMTEQNKQFGFGGIDKHF